LTGAGNTRAGFYLGDAMFKIIILLVQVGVGAQSLQGPSAETYETKEKCQAAIPEEALIAAELLTTGGIISVNVVGARCVSLDDLNEMQGGKSA
jgi:hypothetical protein